MVYAYANITNDAFNNASVESLQAPPTIVFTRAIFGPKGRVGTGTNLSLLQYLWSYQLTGAELLVGLG